MAVDCEGRVVDQWWLADRDVDDPFAEAGRVIEPRFDPRRSSSGVDAGRPSGGSTSASQPTCIWAFCVSARRNEASSALSLSIASSLPPRPRAATARMSDSRLRNFSRLSSRGARRWLSGRTRRRPRASA